MEPNPETAAVVQLIFQLAATGIGAAAVTRELDVYKRQVWKRMKTENLKIHSFLAGASGRKGVLFHAKISGDSLHSSVLHR